MAAIVVSDSATQVEKLAARELQSVLKQATGADFNVVNTCDEGECCFLVGPDAAKFADEKFSTDGLSEEGLIVRTTGKDWILAGGRPRGTLYAVFTFLEEVVGCRWWSSKASTIPQRDSIQLDSLGIKYKPVFEYREVFWSDAFDGGWAMHNKCNGERHRLDSEHGNRHVHEGFVHTFYSLIPPEKYFEKHPEWFSEIDGKRIYARAQLCLTNEEMRRELVKTLKGNLRKNSAATIASVSQNDWDGACQCEKCRVINERGEAESATIVHFVNAVAEEVKKEFPHVSISTLAYDWSQKPPKHVEVSDDVIIQMCTTECSYSHPLTHERNKQFRERIEGWGRIARRIYIWDYVTNFSHYVCPHPNLRTLGPNIKFFAANNVKGIFSQGAWDNAYGAEMAELRAWVLSKLLWDPSRDSDQLIDEFLEGYFGPAGKHIKAYLDLIHDAIEASDGTLGMYEAPVGDKYLTFETLCQTLEYFRAAEKAVADDAELSGRVQVAKLPVLYVFLVRWDEFKEKVRTTGVAWPLEKNIKAVFNEFERVRVARGVSSLGENKGVRGFWPTVEERVRLEGKVIPPPNGCEKLPGSFWADLQAIGFNLKESDGEPVLARMVEDAGASDGLAVWMPGSHGMDAVQRPLWRNPLTHIAAAEGKKLRCKLSVRCEVTGPEGVAFRCGIYLHRFWEPFKTGWVERVIRASEIKDDLYHTYDLGQHEKLNTWVSIYLAPGNNPDNVKGIWLDRAWLVVED